MEPLCNFLMGPLRMRDAIIEGCRGSGRVEFIGLGGQTVRLLGHFVLCKNPFTGFDFRASI